ncbi:DNA ligase D [Peribacillus huizhouensis]|uniref:DNA ligase (ATP) n=1 Tax=Peribacillus huizhouensis TaxID=1501239 RepID=A0ABR6CRK8_9BACI|nr:DNA ligase D [Peribacillus huizhouensis]MBA9027670.1 bifunctional non-homologous end joining protein LigD [Peribacillus huizhouensis]
MKPMLPTYHPQAPTGSQWNYEPKYDGFRGQLTIRKSSISLLSRNGKELLPQFPEIEDFIENLRPLLHEHLPLALDGELVWLENPLKANFQAIQWRGRLRRTKTIEESAQASPCRYIAFDILMHKGISLINLEYTIRKQQLREFFRNIECPLFPKPNSNQLLQYAPNSLDLPSIAEQILLHDGEGIVAKQIKSVWSEGKRSSDWIKTKNWKTTHCFITSYHENNGYFSLGVFNDKTICEIGQVKNGFSAEDYRILVELVKKNAHMHSSPSFYIHPSICIAVHFLHVYEEIELREPQFSHFLLDKSPEDCLWEDFIISQFTFPEKLAITSPLKPLWTLENGSFTKLQYLQYLREVSSWMLPYLENRLLTSIRYPHGVIANDKFFQKNVPDYAPDFVHTIPENNHNYIVCKDLQTLIWLGNQLAIEFHTPFQAAGNSMPDELVLDLDPPSEEQFNLAAKAALEIYQILKPLGIFSFIKTSGNKGLQVHIPLPRETFSYEDTRVFTKFLGDYLTSTFPDDFTIERLKKNRYQRLYLDFVQHHEGKTIITPYSTRGNSFAGVATPLFWEELSEGVHIRNYNVSNVPKRIKKHGCPFKEYNFVRVQQPFSEILEFLKRKKE